MTSIRRVVALSATTLAALAPIAGSQQLQYTHTGFLHGFGSSGHIWDTPNPATGNASTMTFLSQSVRLRDSWNPTVPLEATFGQAWARIRDSLASRGGQNVLVGHSMGGLIARQTYLAAPERRGNISAIITMSSPHQGAVLADSARKMGEFLLDMKRRVDDAVPYLQILIAAVVGLVLSLFFSGGVTISAFWLTFFLAPGGTIPASATQLLEVPALPALRTNSPEIQALNGSAFDASIPRANLMSHLTNNKFMPLKIAAAAGDESESEMIDKFQQARSAFHVCKMTYYATVVGIPAGRRCGWAEKMMGRFDETWQRYVNGSTTQTVQIFGMQFPIVVPRNIPSDGIVPNERSVYPSQSTGIFTQPPSIPGPNHLTVYRSVNSLNALRDAMIGIGMEPVNPPAPPLGVSIDGPTEARPHATCSWTANVSGGTGPYSYSWTVDGGFGGSSYEATYTNGGWLFYVQVSVTAANGAQGSATKAVSVSSGAPICLY